MFDQESEYLDMVIKALTTIGADNPNYNKITVACIELLESVQNSMYKKGESLGKLKSLVNDYYDP